LDSSNKSEFHMIKSTLTKVVDVYVHLPRYIIVGALSAAVNIIIFWLVNSKTGNIYVATLLGNLISVFVNFSGLTHVFKSKFFSYAIFRYSISLVVFYFLSVSITIMFSYIGISDVLARTIALCLLFPIGYLVNRYLVFI
jgi:putative flippase GtrA